LVINRLRFISDKKCGYQEKISREQSGFWACSRNNEIRERLGGEAQPNKKDRDYFLLTTKFSLRARGENAVDPNTDGNSRKNLIRSVESSLDGVNTNYIDLLYPHMWDYTTPVKQFEHNAGVFLF